MSGKGSTTVKTLQDGGYNRNTGTASMDYRN